MGRIVIELTNRCNLRCNHCFDGRHGGRSELALNTVDKILAEAKALGFAELAFTGGEPTTHRRFFEIVARSVEAGYRFGFVSNGWNFGKIQSELSRYRANLRGLTFSMDGATAATHDGLRGDGSFKRLLQAFSICALKQIPFALNMVLTRNNRHEVDKLVNLASALGSSGVRFGHFLATGRVESEGLALTMSERRQLEDNIGTLQQHASIPVVMAPGYHTTELFPCGPLQLEEFNIDWRGNVSLCCHLSSHSFSEVGDDVVGNLAQLSLQDAVARLQALVRQFRAQKESEERSGKLRGEDYAPCLYCHKRFRPGENHRPTASMALRSSNGEFRIPLHSIAATPQESRRAATLLPELILL